MLDRPTAIQLLPHVLHRLDAYTINHRMTDTQDCYQTADEISPGTIMSVAASRKPGSRQTLAPSLVTG